MAQRSSANYISYDLRPAKQSERRILLEVLRAASKYSELFSGYRYIGMGANRFYDFLLMHKYLGVSEMISLERDKKMYKRAVYNCPYGFIEVLNKSTSTFISGDAFDKHSIVWFDYDGGLSGDVIEDVAELGRKIPIGSFCFATVFGGPHGALDKKSTTERLTWFQDEIGDAASGVGLSDVENSNFHIAIYKTLLTAFKTSFSYRTDGVFIPLLCVKYVDSKAMVTVGGGFFDRAVAAKVSGGVHASLPFLGVNEEKLYEIRPLHLTEKERVLFDRAVTSPDYKAKNIEVQLKGFGFVPGDLDAYRELVRFHPRYVETIV